MIYVTGDTHGDMSRLKGLPLHRKDTLIVAGDFGFLWKDDRAERRALKQIGNLPFTTLFIDGTHENFTALERYPATYYGGAECRRLGKRLYWVRRGQVAVLEDRRIFLMGGGDTPFEDGREPGVNWWAEESPSEQEREDARYLLSCVGNQVDFVITHEPPQRLHAFLDLSSAETTPLRGFLDEVAEQTSFTHWYFGSIHKDKRVTPLYTAVFRETIPLYEKERRRKKK